MSKDNIVNINDYIKHAPIKVGIIEMLIAKIFGKHYTIYSENDKSLIHIVIYKNYWYIVDVDYFDIQEARPYNIQNCEDRE